MRKKEKKRKTGDAESPKTVERREGGLQGGVGIYTDIAK